MGIFRKHRGAIIAGTALLAAVTYGKFFATTKLTINTTDSMPKGIYLVNEKANPKLGSIVIFRIPDAAMHHIRERNWLPENTQFMIKPMAGMAGDYACTKDGNFRVGRKDFGAIKATDKEGLPLPEINYCQPISKGKFVAAVAGDGSSFDSRYFGEIPIENIVGQATPIWTTN